ncbi:MAG: hypothetical protein M1823_005691 [Watsoniomyces obsoletus]|nr:MAG: hypothetical protein M1823_005691 [Watsoniomyces obsoletus]
MWTKLSKALEPKDKTSRPRSRSTTLPSSASSSSRKREGYIPSSTAYASSSKSAHIAAAPPSIATSQVTASSNAPQHREPRLVRTESVRDRREHDHRSHRARSLDRHSERTRHRSRSRSKDAHKDRPRHRSRSRERSDRTSDGNVKREKAEKSSRRVSQSDIGDERRSSRALDLDEMGPTVSPTDRRSYEAPSTPYQDERSRAAPTTTNVQFSSRVPDQFPGQFPEQSTAPYRPPLSVQEGGPGLAADYYGDVAGPSFTSTTQPVTSTMGPIATPSASYGGVGPPPAPMGWPSPGSTAPNSNFAAHSEGRPGIFTTPTMPVSQNHPFTSASQIHSASAPIIPTLGAAAVGATAGYMMSQSGHPHNQSPAQHNGSPHQRPPSSQSRPSASKKHSASRVTTHHTGASTAAVAGSVFGVDDDHQQHSEGRPTNPPSYASMALAHEHHHQGPLHSFIDFWRDPEGVGQFEEYTEYIGVCRNCFDPGTTPRDAPRKHHPRRRGSSHSLSNKSRVDKDKRYYSSDSSSGRSKKGRSIVATGLAAYGLGKIGKSLFKSDRDSWDHHSARSGHPPGSARMDKREDMPHKRTNDQIYGRVELKERSRSRSRSRQRHSSKRSVSEIPVSKSSLEKGRKAEIGMSGRPRSRHRSRSRSREGKGKARAGIAVASLASSALGSHSHNSPRKRSSSRRRSSERKHGHGITYERGENFRVERHAVDDHDRHPLHDAASSSKRVTKSTREGRKARSSGKGMFHFENSSASSFSSSSSSRRSARGSSNKRSHKKSAKPKKSSRRGQDAALLGLGTAAALMATSQMAKSNEGKRAVAGSDFPSLGLAKPSSSAYKKDLVSSSSSEDEGWESASDGQGSSGEESALAFGSYDPKQIVKRRGSQESLSSNASSGTNKWNWRWGGKATKDKGKGRLQADPDVHQAQSHPPTYAQYPPSVSSVAYHVADGAGVSFHNAPLQQVYAVPTSDPTQFDIRRRESITAVPSQPIHNPRPVPVPLQQPQPQAPVAASVFAGVAPPTVPHETTPSQFPSRSVTFPVGSGGHDPVNDRRAVTFEPGYVRVADVRGEDQNDDEAEARREAERERKREEARKERARRRQAEEAEALERNKKRAQRSKSRELKGPQILRRENQAVTQDESSIVPIVAGVAVAGAAVAAISSFQSDSTQGKTDVAVQHGRNKSMSQDHDKRLAQESPRGDRRSRDSSETSQSESYRKNKGYEEVPSVMDKYKEADLPMVAYFPLPELISQSSSPVRGEAAIGNTGSREVPDITTSAPSHAGRRGSEVPDAAEETFNINHAALPWHVPYLNLITPTPPRSTRGSVTSAISSPTTPTHRRHSSLDQVVSAEDQATEAPSTGTGPNDTEIVDQMDKSQDIGGQRFLPGGPDLDQGMTQDSIDASRSGMNESSDDDDYEVVEVTPAPPPAPAPSEYQPGHGIKLPESSKPANLVHVADTARHVPGEFIDDTEFAATVAAGLEDTGFDPSIVLDNPSFHRRDSPPGSEAPGTYAASWQSAISGGHKDRRSASDTPWPRPSAIEAVDSTGQAGGRMEVGTSHRKVTNGSGDESNVSVRPESIAETSTTKGKKKAGSKWDLILGRRGRSPKSPPSDATRAAASEDPPTEFEQPSQKAVRDEPAPKISGVWANEHDGLRKEEVNPVDAPPNAGTSWNTVVVDAAPTKDDNDLGKVHNGEAKLEAERGSLSSEPIKPPPSAIAADRAEITQLPTETDVDRPRELGLEDPESKSAEKPARAGARDDIETTKKKSKKGKKIKDPEIEPVEEPAPEGDWDSFQTPKKKGKKGKGHRNIEELEQQNVGIPPADTPEDTLSRRISDQIADATNNDLPPTTFTAEPPELGSQTPPADDFSTPKKKGKKGKGLRSIAAADDQPDEEETPFATPVEELNPELNFRDAGPLGDVERSRAPQRETTADEFELPTKKGKKGKKGRRQVDDVSWEDPAPASNDANVPEEDSTPTAGHEAVTVPTEVQTPETAPDDFQSSKKKKKGKKAKVNVTWEDAEEELETPTIAVPETGAPAEQAVDDDNDDAWVSKSKKKDKKRKGNKTANEPGTSTRNRISKGSIPSISKEAEHAEGVPQAASGPVARKQPNLEEPIPESSNKPFTVIPSIALALPLAAAALAAGDLPPLPPSRPESPVAIGSLRDLPSLPASPSLPATHNLPPLPETRATTLMDLDNLQDLPPLPASPVLGIDNLTSLPTSHTFGLDNHPSVPESRPSSPLELVSAKDLPSRPASPTLGDRGPPLEPRESSVSSVQDTIGQARPSPERFFTANADQDPLVPSVRPTSLPADYNIDISTSTSATPFETPREELSLQQDFQAPSFAEPSDSKGAASASAISSVTVIDRRHSAPQSALLIDGPPPRQARSDSPNTILNERMKQHSPMRTPENIHAAGPKSSSPTAIPIYFRRPPPTPGHHRFSSGSAVTVSGAAPSPTLSRPRHAKTGSSEFKPREFRPLYLVERHSARQMNEAEEDPYPPLPPSRASTRSPSQQSIDDQEQALEEDEGCALPSASDSNDLRRGPPADLRIQTEFSTTSPDLLDSQQPTPKGTVFPEATKAPGVAQPTLEELGVKLEQIAASVSVPETASDDLHAEPHGPSPALAQSVSFAEPVQRQTSPPIEDKDVLQQDPQVVATAAEQDQAFAEEEFPETRKKSKSKKGKEKKEKRKGEQLDIETVASPAAEASETATQSEQPPENAPLQQEPKVVATAAEPDQALTEEEFPGTRKKSKSTKGKGKKGKNKGRQLNIESMTSPTVEAPKTATQLEQPVENAPLDPTPLRNSTKERGIPGAFPLTTQNSYATEKDAALDVGRELVVAPDDDLQGRGSALLPLAAVPEDIPLRGGNDDDLTLPEREHSSVPEDIPLPDGNDEDLDLPGGEHSSVPDVTSDPSHSQDSTTTDRMAQQSPKAVTAPDTQPQFRRGLSDLQSNQPENVPLPLDPDDDLALSDLESSKRDVEPDAPAMPADQIPKEEVFIKENAIVNQGIVTPSVEPQDEPFTEATGTKKGKGKKKGKNKQRSGNVTPPADPIIHPENVPLPSSVDDELVHPSAENREDDFTAQTLSADRPAVEALAKATKEKGKKGKGKSKAKRQETEAEVEPSPAVEHREEIPLPVINDDELVLPPTESLRDELPQPPLPAVFGQVDAPTQATKERIKKGKGKPKAKRQQTKTEREPSSAAEHPEDIPLPVTNDDALVLPPAETPRDDMPTQTLPVATPPLEQFESTPVVEVEPKESLPPNARKSAKGKGKEVAEDKFNIDGDSITPVARAEEVPLRRGVNEDLELSGSGVVAVPPEEVPLPDVLDDELELSRFEAPYPEDVPLPTGPDNDLELSTSDAISTAPPDDALPSTRPPNDFEASTENVTPKGPSQDEIPVESMPAEQVVSPPTTEQQDNDVWEAPGKRGKGKKKKDKKKLLGSMDAPSPPAEPSDIDEILPESTKTGEETPKEVKPDPTEDFFAPASKKKGKKGKKGKAAKDMDEPISKAPLDPVSELKNLESTVDTVFKPEDTTAKESQTADDVKFVKIPEFREVIPDTRGDVKQVLELPEFRDVIPSTLGAPDNSLNVSDLKETAPRTPGDGDGVLKIPEFREVIPGTLPAVDSSKAESSNPRTDAPDEDRSKGVQGRDTEDQRKGVEAGDDAASTSAGIPGGFPEVPLADKSSDKGTEEATAREPGNQTSIEGNSGDRTTAPASTEEAHVDVWGPVIKKKGKKDKKGKRGLLQQLITPEVPQDLAAEKKTETPSTEVDLPGGWVEEPASKAQTPEPATVPATPAELPGACVEVATPGMETSEPIREVQTPDPATDPVTPAELPGAWTDEPIQALETSEPAPGPVVPTEKEESIPPPVKPTETAETEVELDTWTSTGKKNKKKGKKGLQQSSSKDTSTPPDIDEPEPPSTNVELPSAVTTDGVEIKVEPDSWTSTGKKNKKKGNRWLPDPMPSESTPEIGEIGPPSATVGLSSSEVADQQTAQIRDLDQSISVEDDAKDNTTRSIDPVENLEKDADPVPWATKNKKNKKKGKKALQGSAAPESVAIEDVKPSSIDLGESPAATEEQVSEVQPPGPSGINAKAGNEDAGEAPSKPAQEADSDEWASTGKKSKKKGKKASLAFSEKPTDEKLKPSAIEVDAIGPAAGEQITDLQTPGPSSMDVKDGNDDAVESSSKPEKEADLDVWTPSGKKSKKKGNKASTAFFETLTDEKIKAFEMEVDTITPSIAEQAACVRTADLSGIDMKDESEQTGLSLGAPIEPKQEAELDERTSTSKKSKKKGKKASVAFREDPPDEDTETPTAEVDTATPATAERAFDVETPAPSGTNARDENEHAGLPSGTPMEPEQDVELDEWTSTSKKSRKKGKRGRKDKELASEADNRALEPEVAAAPPETANARAVMPPTNPKGLIDVQDIIAKLGNAPSEQHHDAPLGGDRNVSPPPAIGASSYIDDRPLFEALVPRAPVTSASTVIRDSGVHVVDSPLPIHQSPEPGSVRDSGFQDAPSLAFASPRELLSPTMSDRAPAADDESPPQTPQERPTGATIAGSIEQTRSIPGMHGIPNTDLDISGLRSDIRPPSTIEILPTPSPVESTSKDRDSMLFTSPPTLPTPLAFSPTSPEVEQRARELPDVDLERPTAPHASEQRIGPSEATETLDWVDQPSGHSNDARHEDPFVVDRAAFSFDTSAQQSIFSDATSVEPMTEMSSDSNLHPLNHHPHILDPIAEDAADEFPVPRSKSTTSEHPRDPSTLFPSPPQHIVQDRQGLISTDDLIARLSWPPVDEQAETVDIERVKSRDSARPSSTGQRSQVSASLTPDPAPRALRRRDRRSSIEHRIDSPSSPTFPTSQHRPSPSDGGRSSAERASVSHRHSRPSSGLSQRSGGTPPLRRVDRRLSGDLRAANQREAARLAQRGEQSQSQSQSAGVAAVVGGAGALAAAATSSVIHSNNNNNQPSTHHRRHQQHIPADVDTPPSSSAEDGGVLSDDAHAPGAAGPSRTRSRTGAMAAVYEGWGDVQGSPRSPTRPPSVRRRQSLQMLDLERKLEQLVSENRQLQAARSEAERNVADVLRSRDAQLQERDAEVNRLHEMLAGLRDDVARLRELNDDLTTTNTQLTTAHEVQYTSLQAEHLEAQRQWDHSRRELDELRRHNDELSGQVESMVRQDLASALNERNSEIDRLHSELESAREQVRMLQQEILSAKAATDADNFLDVRDEDYFENACQRLCQHVQQWVLRFSKFSDMRGCRLVEEVRDDKIMDRLENAVLDGSDVDIYLNDRVKRRDVFMSVVMTMVWEYIFTRYLFGMDREQRQKLKSLEKLLGEVGPPAAVHKWRATTLTLLSRRSTFQSQREQDTEAVVLEIYHTLSAVLPPPNQVEEQILEALRKVTRSAVDLSIEMRTQRAEYMMLPPLQPEYDTNGDLLRKVYFNAALMNNRSGGGGGGGAESNEDLEARRAIVRMVLFPLVVKKGDDFGIGDEEVVVCPAQVLVAPENEDDDGTEEGKLMTPTPAARGTGAAGSVPGSGRSQNGTTSMMSLDMGQPI